MYSNLNEILDFINNNKKKYLYFLSKMDSFPSVCDYSSYILGAYLSDKFNIEPIYVEGDYQVNDNSHCWLEIDNIIIDFTACQFSMCESLDNEEFSVEGLNEVEGCNSSFSQNEEQLYKMLIEDNNLSVIIEEEDELYDEYLYLGEYNIANKYLNIAKKSKTFDEYLDMIKEVPLL